MLDPQRFVVLVAAVVLQFLDCCIDSVRAASLPLPDSAAPDVELSALLLHVARVSSSATADDVERNAAMELLRQLDGDAPALGGKTSAKRKTRRSCRSRLAGQIEGCLVGYERLLMSTKAYSSEGLSELKDSTPGRVVLRHLCRSVNRISVARMMRRRGAMSEISEPSSPLFGMQHASRTFRPWLLTLVLHSDSLI